MAYLGKTPSQAVRSRYYFTASGSETSLSGPDDASNTLTFTDGNYVDVSLNGVALVAGTDYNTTTANTIGGLSALAANDVVEIIVYDTFSVFGGNVNADLNFKDNAKAVFGTGGDLEIYHDSTQSIIADKGTGQLSVRGENTIAFANANGTEVLAKMLKDGAVELYYDNVKKLETTSEGISVLSTENNGPVINLISNDPADAADFTTEAQIKFFAENDASEITQYATIFLSTGDVTDGTEDGWMYFQTMHNGSLTNTAAVSPDSFYLLNPASTFYFNDVASSGYHTAIRPATPTNNRTITLPNATGTVLLTDGDGSSLTGINTDVSSDTSPQLGGVLDTNGNNIEFPDSTGGEVNRLKFGAGDDLQIYHDGGGSYVKEGGTGHLHIRGQDVLIQNSGGTETYADFNHNGAVELYHDNSVKIATSAAGIDVTGTITFGDSHTIGDDANDNLTLTSSSGENIKFDSAAGNHLFFNNGTEKARFDSSDNFLVGATSTASSDFGAKFLDDGTSKILAIHRQASDGDYIQFARGGTAKGKIKQDSGNIVINATDDFQIETNDGTNAVHVDANGNVGIGTTSPAQLLTIEGDGTQDTRFQIKNPGTGSSDDTVIRCLIGGTTASNYIQFGDSADTNAGQIQYNHNNNSMRFTTGGGERLVLDSTAISTTNSYLRMGQGTGGISLTTNDGYGNANITFNHEAGVPEQGGSSYRIETATDNSGAVMSFEMKSSVTADVAVGLQQILRLEGGAGSGGYASMISEGGTEGRVDLQQGSCKAWVRWEMIGSFSTTDSYNVSSVADDGTSESVITLANAMNNSNWAALLGGTAASTGGGTLSLDSASFQGSGTSPYRTTTKVHTRSVRGDGATVDANDNNLGAFGDQA